MAKPTFDPSLEDLATERSYSRWIRRLIYLFGAGIAAFHLYILGIEPINPWHFRAIHVTLVATLILALIPAAKRFSRPLAALDLALILFMIASTTYTIMNLDQMMYRMVISPTTFDLLFSIGTVLIILEATRRATGWALPIIAFLFMVYAIYGNYLPGIFWHEGMRFNRVAGMLFSDQGIYGLITGISSTYVILFVIFGAFLQISGVGKLFIDASMAIAGKYRGGPAKMGVAASMLFAGISGSAVANVVTTGNFTIPLMKSFGYSPSIAAAIESAASTAGNLTPPIMGPSAFIMSEIIGVPYATIVITALIPAALYFTCLFIIVDFEALKKGLKGMPPEDVPKFVHVFRARGHLMIPPVVMLYVLIVMQASPILAALSGIVSTVLVSWVSRETRIGPGRLCDALYLGSQRTMSVAAACITAGIIVAVISTTGLGSRIGTIMLAVAGDSMLLTLIVTMFVCIILGMGLPTVAAYVVAQSVMAPAVIEVGVPPLAAHLFIFYFAIVSAITPPVAIAAYAAAGIAGSKPFETAWQALRVGAAAYVVPYMFVYGPELLLDGHWAGIILAVLTAVAGIYLLAAAVQGYLYTAAGWTGRGLLFVAALCLLYADALTDAFGLALAVAFYLFQRWRTRIASRSDGIRSST